MTYLRKKVGVQGGGREEHARQRDSLERSLEDTDPVLFMN